MKGRFVHKFASCRYCADEVDASYLPRHEAKCKTQTVEEREAERLKRKDAREAYRKKHNVTTREKYRASMAVAIAKKRPVGRPPGSHTRFFTNGHGKRLSATISIDFKTFRTLILQLAPSLSIDKVEVL